MASIESHYGSYRVVWRENGKKKSKSGFARKRDAELFAHDIERKFLLGELYRETPVTFGEFAGLSLDGTRVLVDDTEPTTWFGRYRLECRKPKTYSRRRGAAQHLRELVPVTFDRITPGQVEDVILGVAKTYPRTAQIVAQSINLILKAARKRGQPVNLDCLGIKAPSHTNKTGKFLTPGEVKTLASKADARGNRTLGNLLRFLALTGLRIEEAVRLTDADVLPDAVIVRDSKTTTGIAQVPLSKQAKLVLAKQRLARPESAEHVFPSPTGKQAHLSHVNAALVELRKTVPGMEAVTFHSMRHTFATILVAANVHPRVAAELMRHSDGGRLFQATYGHLYPNSAAKAIEDFGQAWEALG